jgi:hypothetical protein
MIALSAGEIVSRHMRVSEKAAECLEQAHAATDPDEQGPIA